jgi:hypothetical protein
MTNKKFLLGMLVILLSFGMVLIGCGGGGGGGDPIQVDLSLPNIQDVASFEGTFASNESDQKDLIVDAIEAIQSAGLTDGSSYSITMANRKIAAASAMSRAVESWGPEIDIYDHEVIWTGAVATGFVQESGKSSFASEDYYTVGDYEEYSARIKMAIEFDEVVRGYGNPITLNGKYIYDESLYLKMLLASLDPEKMRFTLKYNFNNGHALSVSKNGKGIKFLITVVGKYDFNKEFSSEAEFDDFDPYTLGSCKIIIDVYDNDNVKKTSKTFTSPDAANEFLEAEIF